MDRAQLSAVVPHQTQSEPGMGSIRLVPRMSVSILAEGQADAWAPEKPCISTAGPPE